MSRLFLHAPNVNVGGGGVLLRALLGAPNLGEVIANLDARGIATIAVVGGTKPQFVRPSIAGRVRAEWRLSKSSRRDDLIFCFHGLPPIFPVKGKVVVFKQNRLHLSLDSLSMFSWRTRLRLSIERLICKMFRYRVCEYIVQTPSMKLAVNKWHGGVPSIRVVPFLAQGLSSSRSIHTRGGGFIYVADGEAHKNHRILVGAWILLAAEGLFPVLSLTLPPRCNELWLDIEMATAENSLKIVNLGALSHEATLACYHTFEALIFPSKSESFGLPLLEASMAGLPIIAGELDYVRDVCLPCQTFDPTSSHSIAAAVKRFLNIAVPPLKIRTPEEFVSEVLR